MSENTIGLLESVSLQEARDVKTSGLRTLTEDHANGASSFKDRISCYGEEYSSDRSREAFFAYLKHRDWSDASREGVPLVRQKTNGSNGTRKLEKKPEFDPQGGEVIFFCQDIKEAAERATELIGPVPVEKREDASCKLREYKEDHSNGKATPIHGFSADVSRSNGNGEAFSWDVDWRIDYDPEKGSHINTMVRPPRIDGSEQRGYYRANDPRSLKIAFIFPGGKEKYEEILDATEELLIAGMIGEVTDYSYYIPKGV